MNPCLAILAIALSGSAPQNTTKPVITADPPADRTATTQGAASTTQTVVRTTAQTGSDSSQEPVQAAPSQVPPPAPDTAASNSYIIGPEDSLQISVWREPGLSGTLPVRPDGMISLSLVGDIPAAGLTPAKLSANIADKLKKFIKDPNVNVIVAAFHVKQVYLLGEVQHVGALAITPDMTPLQALAAAGGVSPFANSRHIYILRGEQGKQKKIPFDYKKALKDGNQQGVTLMPGDTIVVP